MDEDLARIRRKKYREMEERLRIQEAGSVIPLTAEGLTQALRNWPALVVDCWAEWCGPCKTLTPVIHHLAAEFTGRVVFASVNTDQEPGLTRQYTISAIPTLLLFREGRLADRITGAYPIEALRTRILRVFPPAE